MLAAMAHKGEEGEELRQQLADARLHLNTDLDTHVLRELVKYRAGLVEPRWQVPETLLNRELLAKWLPTWLAERDRPADNLRAFDHEKIRIDPMDRIGTYCETLRITFIDLRERLGAEREMMNDKVRPWDDLYTPLDYTHLNRRGLSMAAEELLKLIDAKGWLPAGARAGE